MAETPGFIVEIDGRFRRSSTLITREKILRAAITEIADRGLERARLVDIAARADLTVGSIYTWFKNKSDLFTVALEFTLAEQQLANLKFLQFESESEGETKSNSHWMLLIGALAPRNAVQDEGPTATQKILIEALMSAWRDEESYDTVRPQISKLLEQYIEIITNAIESGAIDKTLDVDLLARLFLAFPIGLSMLTLSGQPDLEPGAFLPFLERFNQTLKPAK